MFNEMGLTFLAYLISLTIGWKLCRVVHGRLNALLSIGLAVHYGMMVTAILLFVQIVLMGRFSRLHALAGILFTLVLVLNLHETEFSLVRKGPKTIWSTRFLVGLAMSIAVLLLMAIYLKSPYGGGLDVWAIWKFKARILFLSDKPLQLLFEPNFKFSHFDYPIFYPLMLVWGWILVGKQSVYAGMWCSILFWSGFLCTAAGFVRELKPKQSWVLPLLFASTPILTGYAASLYADTIVAGYFLTGVVLILLCLRNASNHLLMGAGWMMASAALIKNEGQMACAASLVILVFSVRLIPKIFYFFFGAAMPLGVLIYFRRLCPYENHMLSIERFKEVVDRGDLIPYLQTIFNAIKEQVLNENSWVYGWVFIILTTLLLAFRFLKQKRWIPHLFACLMLASYIGVYIMTFRDLEGHLRTSLDRVMLQIYPIFLMACYFAIAGSSEKELQFKKSMKPVQSKRDLK